MRVCVFTCLTGDYETLNPQPALLGSKFPAFCFTDNPALTSDTWQIRVIEPRFADDPVRSQRLVKILPYEHLPQFDISIYIDNSIELIQPPEALLDTVDLSSGLALPRHSYRASLEDEFAEVLKKKLDDPARLRALWQIYKSNAPALLSGPVYWNGLLIRDHRQERVRQAMEIWRDHVWRYSRRDQLSLPYALSRAGVAPCVLEIDNYNSIHHRWPVINDRKTARRIWQDDDPAAASILGLEQELASLREELKTAQEQIAQHEITIAAILQSTSWRITAPLRSLRQIFK